MKIATRDITFQTKGNCDTVDITSQVAKEVAESGASNGTITLFVTGSTAGLTTIEYEPGLVHDIKAFFDRVVPEGMTYQHDERWHDGNGHSHIRSSLLKNSLTMPFLKGELLRGTWQQVVFIEFDNKARNRKVYLQFTGE